MPEFRLLGNPSFTTNEKFPLILIDGLKIHTIDIDILPTHLHIDTTYEEISLNLCVFFFQRNGNNFQKKTGNAEKNSYQANFQILLKFIVDTIFSNF